MGKFVIHKKANGEFRFNLIADSEKIILFSKAFSTKSSCLKGLDWVKANAKEDAHYERSKSTAGKLLFNLKDEKGAAIGRSNLFDTEVSREKEIVLVKANAISAKLVDEIIKEEKPKPVVVEVKQKYPKEEFEVPKKNAKKRSHYDM